MTPCFRLRHRSYLPEVQAHHATGNPLRPFLGYRPNLVIWMGDHGDGITQHNGWYNSAETAGRLNRPSSSEDLGSSLVGGGPENQNVNSSHGWVPLRNEILTWQGLAISGWIQRGHGHGPMAPWTNYYDKPTIIGSAPTYDPKILISTWNFGG